MKNLPGWVQEGSDQVACSPAQGNGRSPPALPAGGSGIPEQPGKVWPPGAPGTCPAPYHPIWAAQFLKLLPHSQAWKPIHSQRKNGNLK